MRLAAALVLGALSVSGARAVTLKPFASSPWL